MKKKSGHARVYVDGAGLVVLEIEYVGGAEDGSAAAVLHMHADNARATGVALMLAAEEIDAR